MALQQFQVSAFSARPFGGNPAAVVCLSEWLPDSLLQAIAAENNLSETAFYAAAGDAFELRWFTPTVEVDLCGHATLATAHVLFNELAYSAPEIRFTTRGGWLTARRSGASISLDFPAYELAEETVDPALAEALGAQPQAAFNGDKCLYLYANEAQVRALRPDMKALLAASDTPVIVTAPGENVDFVSRFFGPQVGIDEDPVTGSAHCALTPFWSRRLNKTTLEARQVSARGGELQCQLEGDRVHLSGQAVTFMQGTLRL
ncbi:PhzF family phenazine biosynthesis protein [Halieaceae bacterium IMCC14734]|uniref:PhzF family phenazine biosynthesis protein n=1 Tax=Candidatus Litorirhabdus singularis TaxID=2518993 RepID=A0ABT3TGT4_9GAMM|nr:PhzF family phenazine biosynthesis protein [Candidatus Litorirhabdus singularis]MCX2981517.1 PhzF family phenazine biosynthesis protein [Candidatus Litorirhabdus singularis]